MASLANAKPKVVNVTLNDGITRPMKFTLNSLAELEDRYGTIEAAFEALNSNSIKAVRLVLWAGLVHADENLTERQVGALIDIDNMENIVEALSEAFGNSLPADTPVVAREVNPNA